MQIVNLGSIKNWESIDAEKQIRFNETQKTTLQVVPAERTTMYYLSTDAEEPRPLLEIYGPMTIKVAVEEGDVVYFGRTVSVKTPRTQTVVENDAPSLVQPFEPETVSPEVQAMRQMMLKNQLENRAAIQQLKEEIERKQAQKVEHQEVKGKNNDRTDESSDLDAGSMGEGKNADGPQQHNGGSDGADAEPADPDNNNVRGATDKGKPAGRTK